jgi:hypothetical protein
MFKKQKVEQSETDTSNKPTKYFDDQFDDEEVLFVFRKHPIVMRKGIVVWAAAILIGPLTEMVLLALHKEVSTGTYFMALGASFLFSLIVFSPWYISWYFSVFIITNQRLIQITQKGLFHRSVVDMGLNQIQMVNYEIAGLQETLLGFGTIMMQTFVGDLVIHDVHHPAKIQKKIIGILRDQGISTGTSPVSNQSASDNAAPLTDEEETQAA